MKDITYVAAFPKSGITYLNFMLFHILFDAPQDVAKIDSDYIFDLHESLARVPPTGAKPHYVKLHAPFSPSMPLYVRGHRAIELVRDPIDVMMSAWDFRHLLGDDSLLRASETDHARKFDEFRRHWITSGGAEYPFAGSWVENVRSWLRQKAYPTLIVQYEKLKADPEPQLRRILDFLEHPAPAERIARAVEAGKVDNMRKQESEEIRSGTSGAFFRPFLVRGYAAGYRFIGKLNQKSYDKVLTEAERREVDRTFGSIMAEVGERAV